MTETTALNWYWHTDEEASNHAGHRVECANAASKHVFADGARGEYLVGKGHHDDIWTVELSLSNQGVLVGTPFSEQYTTMDLAMSAGQRHDDALRLGVAEFMNLGPADRHDRLARAQQLIDDANRAAAVLFVAEASVLARNLSDQINHIDVVINDGHLRILRFLDADCNELDIWDEEQAGTIARIRDMLADAYDAEDTISLFTFREAIDWTSDLYIVQLFPAA